MDVLPILIWWSLIALAAVLRWPLYIYLFSISAAFGDLTLLPLGVTSGTNLPVQAVCAIILVVRVVGLSQNFRRGLALAFDPRRLGFLTLFSAYAIITAVLLPRLYQGNVMLYSLNQAASETPLAPSSANFNESIYLLASTAVLFAFALSASDTNFRTHFLRSVLLLGMVLIVSGALDFGTAAIGQAALLRPLHNAGYNLLSGETLGGDLRVVGFMAEASVFGGVCCAVLAFLMFNARMYAGREWLLRGTCSGLVICILASTSSTGYLGLAALVGLFLGRAALRAMRMGRRASIPTRWLVAGMLATLAIAGGVAWMVASSDGSVTALLNLVLFSKTESGSFLERNAWTDAGLAAFMATSGVGVGWGSVRTSDWIVNIAASTGVVGLSLLGLTAFTLLRSAGLPRDGETRYLAGGLRLALVPVLLMMCVSGTTPDPGPWVMSLMGLCAGLKWPRMRTDWLASGGVRIDQGRKEGGAVAGEF